MSGVTLKLAETSVAKSGSSVPYEANLFISDIQFSFGFSLTCSGGDPLIKLITNDNYGNLVSIVVKYSCCMFSTNDVHA